MASVAAATAPVAKTDPAAGEKKLPPPSPLRSILAGSLAGGIEICASRVPVWTERTISRTI